MQAKHLMSYLNTQSMKQQKKYIPTPEAADIIMSYFIFNNFQDFNTWQQIARTKSDYDYVENAKGIYECKMTLKWEDKNLPGISKVAEGKNKKEAKKKAMERMIQDLMYQGYIAYGFKQDDFVKKIPRRRRQSSSSDQPEEKIQEIGNAQSKIRQLLMENKFNEALQIMNTQNIAEVWHYALGRKEIKLCEKVVNVIERREQSMDEEWYDSCEKQIDESIKEDDLRLNSNKNPLEEELTDFLHLYQLQQEQTQESKTNVHFKSQLIPSQAISNQVLNEDSLMQFYPISSRIEKQKGRLVVKSCENSFLQLPYEIEVPMFEGERSKCSYKVIQGIYDGLLFYGNDYDYGLGVCKLIRDRIEGCKLGTKYHQPSISYYLRFKHMLVSQFLYLLYIRTINYQHQLAIQGMVTQTNGKSPSTLLTFISKEPEDILAKKITKKNNTNQFQELPTISSNEYVLIVSKINNQQRYIAYIKQVHPNIKLIAPQLPYELNVPHPYTIYKLTNAKLYQKISTALLQVAKHSISILTDSTYVLYQPITYTRFNLIAELLCQLLHYDDMILLVSPSIDILYNQLVNVGFKCIKITPKFDEKQISKYQLICCTPNAVCSDVLKNYAFSRVILDDAHQISQIMSLLAISKGCKKLFLIGDINLPRTRVLSKYCRQLGMDCSLMERLMKEGASYWTYHSHHQPFLYHHTLLEWVNQHYYNNKLNINYNQTPIIKGFPWPSQSSRIALIQASISRHIYLVLCIIGQVLKTGFMTFDQIICIVGSNSAQHSLINYLTLFIKVSFNLSQQYFEQVKIQPMTIAKAVKVIDGRPIQKDLCIVMIGREKWEERQLIGSMLYGIRGLIMIGDWGEVRKWQGWGSLVNWSVTKRIILKDSQ